MNQWEQAILDRTWSVLRQTWPYQERAEYDEAPPEENFQVCYILTKGSLQAPENILAIAAYEDEVFSFHPLEPRGEPIMDWPPVNDYDIMLFQTLADGFDLTMMTPFTHYCVWSDVSDWYEIGACTEYPEGLKKYLDTCQQYDITQQFLKERYEYDGMDKGNTAQNRRHEKENVIK